jgi:hypothetical protein
VSAAAVAGDAASTLVLIRAFRPDFCRMLAEEFAPWRAQWRRINPLIDGKRTITDPRAGCAPVQPARVYGSSEASTGIDATALLGALPSPAAQTVPLPTARQALTSQAQR